MGVGQGQEAMRKRSIQEECRLEGPRLRDVVSSLGKPRERKACYGTGTHCSEVAQPAGQGAVADRFRRVPFELEVPSSD